MYLNNYSSFAMFKILSFTYQYCQHTVNFHTGILTVDVCPEIKINHILIELCGENYMYIIWKNLMGKFCEF